MPLIDFTTKRKLRRIVYSKPVAIGLFALVCFLSYVTHGMYETSKEAHVRRDTAAAELAELEEREQYLTAEIERLQTARGLEAEVREKFDVAKEGEKVIVILEEAREPEKESVVDEPRSWIDRIKEWFE